MNIKTRFEYPPIPIRAHDWYAWDDDTYDGPGSPLGTGESEQQAVEDLLSQVEDCGPLLDSDNVCASCGAEAFGETSLCCDAPVITNNQYEFRQEKAEAEYFN
jgi:hypothetical protein